MGNDNKVEMLVALCALVTSVVAVYIAWDQGRVMRAQQHGEVYPVLQVDGTSSNSLHYSELGLNVSNSGVGPALIESVELIVDGEVVTDLLDVVGTLPLPSSDSSAALAGRALAPGEKIEAIDLRWDRSEVSPEEIGNFALATSDWQLKICYCSVFGRCWQTSRIGTGRAERINECRSDETDVFSNFSIRNYPRNANPDTPTGVTLTD